MLFHSGIYAKSFIKGLQSEIDSALPIPDDTYISWLNETEQFLYTGLIQSPVPVEFTADYDSGTPIENPLECCRFCDVVSVYASYDSRLGRQLIKTERNKAHLLHDCYYDVDGKIGYNLSPILSDCLEKITVFKIDKPTLKTTDNWATEDICVPTEFAEMIRSKLRANAFMLCGEYATASNFIALYNSLLETFKAWIASQPRIYG